MGRGHAYTASIIWLAMVVGCGGAACAQTAPTQEFQQTYSLPIGKEVRIRNDYGNVHVTAWDRQEVKVQALKRANPPATLASAEVTVQQPSDKLCIATKYPAAKQNIKTWFGFTLDLCRDWQNISGVEPAAIATVDYAVAVPRNAKMIVLVYSGDVEIEGTTGDVMVDIQRGHLTARDVSGDCKLYGSYSGVNVTLNSLARDTHIQSAVGPLVVTLAPGVSARVTAQAQRGVENDFGWQQMSHQPLQGSLGGGKVQLTVHSSGGRVEIRRLAAPVPPVAAKKQQPPAPRKR